MNAGDTIHFNFEAGWSGDGGGVRTDEDSEDAIIYLACTERR